jgi:hypothetical protein
MAKESSRSSANEIGIRIGNSYLNNPKIFINNSLRLIAKSLSVLSTVRRHRNTTFYVPTEVSQGPIPQAVPLHPNANTCS